MAPNPLEYGIELLPNDYDLMVSALLSRDNNHNNHNNHHTNHHHNNHHNNNNTSSNNNGNSNRVTNSTSAITNHQDGTDSDPFRSRKRRAKEEIVLRHVKPPPWSEQEHRAFVSAIYNVGVQNASPSVIRDNMQCTPPCITSERVKSHLQKYRINRTKGKQEFMSTYDVWMNNGNDGDGDDTTKNKRRRISPYHQGLEIPAAGEVAAFLSHGCMEEEKEGKQKTPAVVTPQHGESTLCDASSTTLQRLRNKDDYLHLLGTKEVALVFPKLTEEETKSSLGVAFSHVKDMFGLMMAQMEQQQQQQVEHTT